MAEKIFKIVSNGGLHARPATALVKVASSFECEVQLEFKGKSVNVKSIMGILSLAIPSGAEVKISTKGTDEKMALQTITEALTKEGIAN